MPDKNLTIATYAAGAGLAAVALVYVFGPTYLIDNESAHTTARSRKNTIIGLSNPANDCFINSVLQALAGLGDLRIYLTQETHRRDLGGDRIYAHVVEDDSTNQGLPIWKIEGLQAGMVTFGLRDMLNRLNERPIYKKTISAGPFVQCLQNAFKQKISRQQQDAQEFLQVLAERLCDEYHAGHRARDSAYKIRSLDASESVSKDALGQALSQLAPDGETLANNPASSESETEQSRELEPPAPSIQLNGERDLEDEESGFPFEGSTESQLECSTCGFKPKANKSTFCSLTLSVPQVGSTTLSSCFDQMFKTEHIEDFKCEKCRLVHALKWYEEEYTKSNSEKFRSKTKLYMDKIKTAIETDPEDELKDVEMPDKKFAPKRKIARHNRITEFPKVMAIHLSRSIFDASRSTMKNSAKVSFPERLPLGGLANRRFYRLSSVVCHKGSHHSGHYETFRRQALIVPYSNSNTFKPAAVYGKAPTPMASEIDTPLTGKSQSVYESNGESTLNTPEILSPSSATSATSATSSTPSLSINGHRASSESSRNGSGQHLYLASSSHTTVRNSGPTSAPRDLDNSSTKDVDATSIRSIAKSAKSTISSKFSRSKTSSPSTSDSAASPAFTPDKKGEVNGGSGQTSVTDGMAQKKKRKATERWWRISDDKIKESKTSEVLGMQREVYLLFYELEKDEEAQSTP